MLVKRVVLDNIRSYTHAEINFPQGSILLSGDIGSGKSTVLMAIEFALFGLKRTELSGASLLRNGADKGSVEVELEVEGKRIIIGRALKKTSSAIAQDAGFIEDENGRKPLTAIEIKQRVLELLNYPKEALTKNEMLFRHTVYVSQEEMKQILLGDKEARLNALRHVFGIDRYKRVKENAKIVSSKAGEKKKEILGAIADLDAKKALEKSRKIELESIEKGIAEVVPIADEARISSEKKKEELLAIEEETKKANELKKELAMCEQRAGIYAIHKANDERELKRIEEKIKLMGNEKLSGRDFQKEVSEKKNAKKEAEARLSEISNRLYELNMRKKACEELKKRISLLEDCPTCKQKVCEEHKSRINDDENRKLADIEKEVLMHSGNEKDLRSAVERINAELDLIWEEEKKELLLKAKLKEYEEALKSKSSAEEKLRKDSEELKNAIERKEQVQEGLKLFAELEKKHLMAKKSLDAALAYQKEIELRKAQLEAKKEMALRALDELSAEIGKKEQSKKVLEKVSMLKEWIDYYFTPLMDNMEKAVMAKAHTEFSSLLEKWFSMLVDNEAISIRLDEEFTPLIEQNGYEIDYGFLSGGEKTAAALAYRLALNQVVNNMMNDIKTKGIIILDEPTDGFSDEQLDRMKNVLNELSIGQVIIVSHEQKIESFVENVIRFEKKGHESKVVSRN